MREIDAYYEHAKSPLARCCTYGTPFAVSTPAFAPNRLNSSTAAVASTFMSTHFGNDIGMCALSFTVAVLLALSGFGASQHDRWPWPVPGRDVVRHFEPPPEPWAAGHRGVDIRSPVGTVVTAVADSTVHFAGTVVDRGVVSLDHGDGILTSYEPVTSLVERGDAVMAGEPIAIVEGHHRGCGACLHFGVRQHGEYVDPMLFLTLERPVLLPLAAMREGAHLHTSAVIGRTRRAYTSGLSPDLRDRAAPALHASRLHRRADG